MIALTAFLLLAGGQGQAMGRPLDRDAAQYILPVLAKCTGSANATNATAKPTGKGKGKASRPSRPATIPPGLVEGKNVTVAAIPNTDEHAFSYQGTGPNMVSCGVALYGAVDPVLRDRIRHFVSDNPNWVLAPGFYTGPVDATTTYWGDSNARGLRGVAIISRPLSPDAPTLEIEYHSTLVR